MDRVQEMAKQTEITRKSNRLSCAALLVLAFGAVAAFAQYGSGNPPPPMQPNRPPMERAFQGRGGMGREGMGRWWDNPQVAKDLNLATDQKQKMDDIFQQSRLKLIDLHAALQREEAILDPLINADSPDQAKTLAQIDRVAEARAELEKSNGRMLLAIRQVLTADQWSKLKAARERRMSRGPRDGALGMGLPPPN